jgi:hypothetical protein
MMYYKDHAPPHFHAVYGDSEAVVQISPIGFIGGQLPPRASSLVLEWAALHQDELLADWRRCRDRLAPVPIAPLE